MTKRPTKRAAVVKAAASQQPDGPINAAPVAFAIGANSIVALQVYHNPERKPDGDGPWTHEADKVAWVDEETGLGCIMLRQTNGTISGYVGVPPEHPLFGFEADAVPLEVSRMVHGGVTYGRACEVNRYARVASGKPRKERYTVCHVTRTRLVQDYRMAQTTEDEFHEDLWWLGFDTHHSGDFVPGSSRSRRAGDVYRDQSFVYANCIALARKLKSVGDASNAENRTETPLSLLPPSDDLKGGGS